MIDLVVRHKKVGVFVVVEHIQNVFASSPDGDIFDKPVIRIRFYIALGLQRNFDLCSRMLAWIICIQLAYMFIISSLRLVLNRKNSAPFFFSPWIVWPHATYILSFSSRGPPNVKAVTSRAPFLNCAVRVQI